MPELHVLVPRGPEWITREKTVLRAVFEAAGEIGAERVSLRRCDVYAIGIYLKEESSKKLVYIDVDWRLGERRIKEHIICSAAPSSRSIKEGFGGLQFVIRP